MGKTAQESHVVGKMGDALMSVGIEASGGITIDYSQKVGIAVDALQAYGGAQTIGIGTVMAGYTSATALPVVLVGIGGAEIGSAFNHLYERLSGQSLGEDIYDWLHDEECQ